jgi:hypothetical protein
MISGLVQKCWFLGDSFDRFFMPSAIKDMVEAGYVSLITTESLESKQFQPVRMFLSGE